MLTSGFELPIDLESDLAVPNSREESFQATEKVVVLFPSEFHGGPGSAVAVCGAAALSRF